MEFGSVKDYLLVEKIGTGKYGVVFKGQHTSLANTIVAVKIFKDIEDEQKAYQAIKKEADMLDALRHQHILRVHDVGVRENQWGGREPFLITDFATNGTLRERLDRQKIMPPSKALLILNQISDGLQHAHDHGIVHLDLKPANILFDERQKVLLADFGIAVLLESTKIQHSEIVGTLAYMAPERFSGESRRESDQYALGCIANELLTGELPFPIGDPNVLIKQHLYDIPRDPHVINQALSPEVTPVILKALNKDYTQRYPSVADFTRALQTALLPNKKTAFSNPRPLPDIAWEKQDVFFDKAEQIFIYREQPVQRTPPPIPKRTRRGGYCPPPRIASSRRYVAIDDDDLIAAPLTLPPSTRRKPGHIRRTDNIVNQKPLTTRITNNALNYWAVEQPLQHRRPIYRGSSTFPVPTVPNIPQRASLRRNDALSQRQRRRAISTARAPQRRTVTRRPTPISSARNWFIIIPPLLLFTILTGILISMAQGYTSFLLVVLFILTVILLHGHEIYSIQKINQAGHGLWSLMLIITSLLTWLGVTTCILVQPGLLFPTYLCALLNIGLVALYGWRHPTRIG